MQIVSEKVGFRPATVTVRRGGTVTWRNTDKMPHNVVGRDGAGLSSPGLTSGQTYSHTFSKAGTFRYYCNLHPKMPSGTVIVR